MRTINIPLNSNGFYEAQKFVRIGVTGDNLSDTIVISCDAFADYAADAFFIKFASRGLIAKDVATYADGKITYLLKRNSQLYGDTNLQVQIEKAGTGTDVIVWQSGMIHCVLGPTIQADAAIEADEAPYMQQLYQDTVAQANRAETAADAAQNASAELSTADIIVEMLAPSAAATGAVRKSSEGIIFDLGIPRSNLAYASFEVDASMNLIMSTPEGYAGVDFALTDSGDLEVIINGND